MPPRPPASPNTSADPDTSRHWLWVALLTGLLALLLAGAAMARHGGSNPAACPASRAFQPWSADCRPVFVGLSAPLL